MFMRRLRELLANAVAALALLLFVIYAYYFMFHHEQYHARLDWFYSTYPGVTAALFLLFLILCVRDFIEPGASEDAKTKAAARIGLFGLASLFFMSKALHVL
jgi:hypothetical protein